VQALWQAQQQRYEVDPRAIGTPGLPQYVALMGRFLARVYERCFGQNSQPDSGLMQIWNDFRWGVANYLIQSVPEFRGVKLAGEDTALFKALKRMEVAVGTEPVQRLALELMRRFDCDWRQANLKDKMLVINQERGLMPHTVIESALAAEGIGAGTHAG
jgi:hypothetical protein